MILSPTNPVLQGSTTGGEPATPAILCFVISYPPGLQRRVIIPVSNVSFRRRISSARIPPYLFIRQFHNGGAKM